MNELEIVPFAGDAEERGENSSAAILSELHRARRAFRDWQENCDLIDTVYGSTSYSGTSAGWDDVDDKLDIFWASYEVMKPAVYARPPKPAIASKFRDNVPLLNKTGEFLERAVTAAFDLTCIDTVMQQVRDDVLFYGRGVMWGRYEDDDGQKVCIEHVDRTDFLHEPSRKWEEVSWVARRCWLTRDEVDARFDNLSDEVRSQFNYSQASTDEESLDSSQTNRGPTQTARAAVWEVWHKGNNKVYWVSEGVDTILDSGPPHLKLTGKFPCPRPAYATLRLRSLIPVPDWNHYAAHLRKISELTGRIYTLLNMVRMKGLIAGGGDIGKAVEQLVQADDDSLLIPVEGVNLVQGGGAANMVQWLPLAEIAAAIQGLIDARTQLVMDFYELSGISDIMRGATEANETLGAQELKSHYGSVRVEEKVREIQRVAADMVKIVAEIMGEKFKPDLLQRMAQMELPTKADLTKRVKEVEKAAKEELATVAQKAQEEAAKAQMQAQQSGEQIDPAQAEQAFQQAQKDVIAKYAPMLQEVEQQIPLEEVMRILRDEADLCLAFDIESDSTILQDEMSEKTGRAEFLNVLLSNSQNLAQFMQMGEEGVELASTLLGWAVAPYRAGRDVMGTIDALRDAAPEIAARMAESSGESEEMAAATKMLGEAEMQKAQAQMMKVEADGLAKQAENERKMMELQVKAQNDASKFENEQQKLALEVERLTVELEEKRAKIDNIEADTIKKATEAGLLVEDFNMRQFESLNNIQLQAQDRASGEEQRMIDNDRAERGESRADNAEERAFRGEDRADRQVNMSGRNPE